MAASQSQAAMPSPDGENAANRPRAHHNPGIVLDAESAIYLGLPLNVSSIPLSDTPLQAKHSVLRTWIDPVGLVSALKRQDALRHSGDLGVEISER